MARLVLECQGERREIRITGPITVGRAKTASICIDDLALSREHVRVYADAGRYLVTDLDSKNGTFLNNALIKRAEILKSGDRIKVGPVTLTFYAMDTGELPASRPETGPARARPRDSGEVAASAPNPMLGLLTNIALVAILLVGTMIFKEIFKIVLGFLPS